MSDETLRTLERRARASGIPDELAALATARERAGLSAVERCRLAIEDLSACPPEWRPLRGGPVRSWTKSRTVSPRDVDGRSGSSACVGDVVWCHKAKAAALVVGVVGSLPSESGYGLRGQSARLCVTSAVAMFTVTSYPKAAYRSGERLRLDVPAEWKRLAMQWRSAECARRHGIGQERRAEEERYQAESEPAGMLVVDDEGEACGRCYGSGLRDGDGPDECDACEGTGAPL